MTRAAVLTDRRMLPQIRATLFGVALLAGCVHALSGKQIRRIIAMRIVATGTVHFAFEKWMRECFHGLGTLRLVAIETNFRLRRGL